MSEKKHIDIEAIPFTSEYDYDPVADVLAHILSVSEEISELVEAIRHIVPNEGNYLPEVLKAQNRLLWVHNAIEKDNSDDPF